VLVSSETEVSQFKVHIFIKENVLEFDISVNYSLVINVFKLFNHLSGEISAHIFSHSSQLFAQVEKKRSLDIFHDKVDLVSEGLSIVMNNSIITITVKSNNSLMLEGVKDLNFLSDTWY